MGMYRRCAMKAVRLPGRPPGVAELGAATRNLTLHIGVIPLIAHSAKSCKMGLQPFSMLAHFARASDND